MEVKVRKILNRETESYKDLGTVEMPIMAGIGQDVSIKGKKYKIKSLFISKDKNEKYLEV